MYDEYKKYFYGLVPATNQIEKGVPFKIESVSFANLAFKGNSPLEINISLYNQNQEFKESVSETIPIDDLDEQYIQFVSSIDCKIISTIEEGDYLAVGYRPKGCKEWKEMRGGYQTQSRIPLLGNNFASAQDVLVLSSGDKYDDVHWGIQASRKIIKKNEEFFIKTGLVSNTTFEPFNGKISAALFGKDGTLKYRVTENSTTILPALHAGECKEYTIQSCKVTKDIEEGDYIALCYQSQNSDTWNRIPPLTRVTGRITLQTQEKEPILEEETSFHFDKMKKQITLTTLENTSFDWQNAEGSSIKTGKAANGIISIDAAGLSKGNYKLILENGTQSKTIQIIL